MSGVRIEFAFEDQQFRTALNGLTDPARRTALLRAIGVGLLRNTRDRFETSRDPAGRAWAPLNPAYAAGRRYPGMPILQQAGDRGGLKGTLSMSTHGMDTVIVGSNKRYAAVHQFGATIRPKAKRALVFRLGPKLVFARKVTIPARPYLGFGPEDQDVVLDALHVLLPGG